MYAPPKRQLFYRPPRNNIYRIYGLLFLILIVFWIWQNTDSQAIQDRFVPPTPTRTAFSFVDEGDTHFTSGQIDASIQAYQEAVRIDPTNAEVWAKLARIQVYSSSLLTTDGERRIRLEEALASADQAVSLAPDSSQANAIRALALDWNAGLYLFSPSIEEQREGQRLLNQAEQEIARAILLDQQNVLAQAFYAEILIDQQRIPQGLNTIEQILESGADLMDVHRVYAYALESTGQYLAAVAEYDKAIAITPNLTFLYLRAGANWRQMGFNLLNETGELEQARPLYSNSLDYFAKATRINERLGVKDPTPYLSISKTYSQMGEYFIAGRNVQKALEFQPDNADVYGQLGIVYFKSRNYEGSIPAFKCAIEGCTAEESCEGRGGCGPNDTPAQVTGLPLTSNTVVYYYTYGSVLAALSRPAQNYCPKALNVFDQIRAVFSDNDILTIIQAGETICADLAIQTAVPQVTATPQVTPTP